LGEGVKNNKTSMKNIDKIKCVLIDFEQNDKTLDEAAEEILRLFGVVGRSEQLPTDIEVGKIVSDLVDELKLVVKSKLSEWSVK